ncbi:MAG: hypothetical protein M4579_004331 [Chaenotheca gracillima]|nr:MAG: hypothetical protein M4579_004331 [Chaenotheca gracillima]
MNAAASNPSRKRKHGPNESDLVPSPRANNGRAQKRAKTQDARRIATQTSDKALKEGQLDVDKFVKAREWEIKALEASMTGAKKALATRAFQSVPKHMRRRTASHNVKKVPKRLRPRAGREMAEDNTPTVLSRRRKPQTSRARIRLETSKKLQHMSAQAKSKDKKTKDPAKDSSKAGLSEKKSAPKKNANIDMVVSPPPARGKYRKRQVHKSWLPTHIFHAKRAHMTPPKEPLWRFAIPLSPNEKVYRITHRASSARGAVAWDMSYMSTIYLEGVSSSIQTILESMGAGKGGNDKGLVGKNGKLWREGKRAWEGWLFAKGGWPAMPLAPVTVIWCAPDADAPSGNPMDVDRDASEKIRPKKKSRRSKVFVRVHPAAFLEIWNEILALSKSTYPPVKVEDLRFEIGSIEVMGPGSTEALLGTLWPSDVVRPDATESSPNQPASPAQVWNSLAGLTNPAALPQSALLAMHISDPRLHHPPRTIPRPFGDESEEDLLNVLASWPPHTTQGPAALFSRSARLAASRQLPSQKSINKRKGLAPPGAYPEPVSTDPRIPIILLASRPSSRGGQGSWTVLLPWKCVLPVWYTLIHYPLSTGETVRFGGLDERRQVSFEAGVPWFPADFPGTKAGIEWENAERKKRKLSWERRPRGKRTEWEKVDLRNGEKGEVGIGWSCDWGKLVPQQAAVKAPTHPKKTSMKKEGQSGEPGDEEADDSNLGLYSLFGALATQVCSQSAAAVKRFSNEAPSKALVTVKVTVTKTGTFKPCARLYRLPTDDSDSRRQWLDLASGGATKESTRSQSKSHPRSQGPTSSAQDRRRLLAASLLESPVARVGPPAVGDADYPAVPLERDLIGFVTTGNYSLSEGQCVGFGAILATKVVSTDGQPPDRHCIIRDAGQGFGRLARWDVV